jgi:beta-lactamase class A
VNLLRSLLLAVVVLATACAPLRMGHEPGFKRPGAPAAPMALTLRLEQLRRDFGGSVGIAVHDLKAGWTTGANGLAVLPQQSVSKLWVAITLLDAVDRGEIDLSEAVTVTPADLSLFNQPIRDKLVGGVYRTTLADLLVLQIALSDNAANDILIRRVGGADVVQKTIAAKRLGAIHAGPEERVLQPKIAALAWKSEYSFGRVFWTERDALDPAVRHAALDAYLADPDDGATPAALVEALARLRKGELLSQSSTARLLQVMAQTSTGPNRLPAGLPMGWTISHKTGTGQDLFEQSTGYNDVGLIAAPDGRAYAVAVMIGSTTRPVPERMTLMATVAAAVVAAHDGADPLTAVPRVKIPSSSGVAQRRPEDPASTGGEAGSR